MRSPTEALAGGCWLLAALERAREGLGCTALRRPHDPPSPCPLSHEHQECSLQGPDAGRTSPAPRHILRRSISSNRALLVVQRLGSVQPGPGLRETPGRGVSALSVRRSGTQAVRFCRRRSRPGSARSSAAPGKGRAGVRGRGRGRRLSSTEPSTPGRPPAPPRPAHPAHGAQRVEHAEVILAGLRALPAAVHSLDAAVVVCRAGPGGPAGWLCGPSPALPA